MLDASTGLGISDFLRFLMAICVLVFECALSRKRFRALCHHVYMGIVELHIETECI